MVKHTFNAHGVALPAVEDGAKAPFLVRLGYAWKALRGDFRIVGVVDISHVESDGYMEGRLRVWLSKGEAERYLRA